MLTWESFTVVYDIGSDIGNCPTTKNKIMYFNEKYSDPHLLKHVKVCDKMFRIHGTLDEHLWCNYIIYICHLIGIPYGRRIHHHTRHGETYANKCHYTGYANIPLYV